MDVPRYFIVKEYYCYRGMRTDYAIYKNGKRVTSRSSYEEAEAYILMKLKGD